MNCEKFDDKGCFPRALEFQCTRLCLFSFLEEVHGFHVLPQKLYNFCLEPPLCNVFLSQSSFLFLSLQTKPQGSASQDLCSPQRSVYQHPLLSTCTGPPPKAWRFLGSHSWAQWPVLRTFPFSFSAACWLASAHGWLGAGVSLEVAHRQQSLWSQG